MTTDQRAASAGRSPFLRNAWYLAGWAPDLSSGGLNRVALLGEPVLIYRLESGGWAALEDICCHRLVPLSLGRQEGDCIRCMYHGLKFAPDGRCIEIPAQTRISSSIRVRSYAVAEKHGGIWVWMGQADLADVAEIPQIPGTDDPALCVACATIAIEGDASLIWDNLNDLTHVPFVHQNSFAGGDPAAIAAMIAGEAQVHVAVHGRGVRSEKWHLNKPSHPFFGLVPCDEFLISDFVAPGVLTIRVESYPAGIRERYSGHIPPEERLSVRVAAQVVTPVTAATSLIHFNIGTLAQFAEHVPAQLAVAQTALLEDKRFIDQQQMTMHALPHRECMVLSMDVAVVRFHSVMKKLLAEEQAMLVGAT